MSDLIQRAIREINLYGYRNFAQRVFLDATSANFAIKKNKVLFRSPTWKDINFKALCLNGNAKLLLNPADEGFSKEFYLSGFREPLNTFAIFKNVEKKNPVILDVGSNLGYFPLVELQAGAKHVIAVEPVPSTFALLSRTLKGFKNATLLNMALSDAQETLKLYVSNNRNVTSSSEHLLSYCGHKISEEIYVEATSLPAIADQYPISAVRMDVEGHEYRILGGNIPNQIETICIELHTIPPYRKIHTAKLLRHLNRQGFQAAVVITEMGYGYYSIVKYLGLKTTYKLVRASKGGGSRIPNIELHLSLIDLLKRIPEKGQIHLILER
jgi:FkbM family methyltransferase